MNTESNEAWRLGEEKGLTNRLLPSLFALALGLNIQAACSQTLFQSASQVLNTDVRKLSLVANAQIVSALTVSGQTVDIAGRTSMHLERSDDELASGKVKVVGFNVVYSNVPQALLSKNKHSGSETGVVGFAADPRQGPQYLDYDPPSNTISGKIFGYIDASFMNQTEEAMGDADNDYFEMPRQSAYLSVDLSLNESLESLGDKEGVTKQTGVLSFVIAVFEAESVVDSHRLSPSYNIRLQKTEFEMQGTNI